MKNLSEVLSPSERKRVRSFEEALKTGRRKKWVLPNQEEDFDVDEALKNFTILMKSRLTQNHAKRMKKKHGE